MDKAKRYLQVRTEKKRETMKPYQIVGIIVCCAIFFAGIVALLSMQGIHILLACLGIYLLAVFLMLGMQRAARGSLELMEEVKLYKFRRNYSLRRTHARQYRHYGPSRRS